RKGEATSAAVPIAVAVNPFPAVEPREGRARAAKLRPARVIFWACSLPYKREMLLESGVAAGGRATNRGHANRFVVQGDGSAPSDLVHTLVFTILFRRQDVDHQDFYLFDETFLLVLGPGAACAWVGDAYGHTPGAGDVPHDFPALGNVGILHLL